MARLSIDIKQGTLKAQQTIFGIDLGTTNSLAAYIHEGKAQIIEDPIHGHKLMPSVVHFDEQGEVVVGHKALEHLENQSNRTIYSAKRLLGRSHDDLQGEKASLGYRILESESDESLVRIAVDDRYFTPVEISAEILKSLKQRVESALNLEMNQVVITVPAYFNDSQRQATRDAGKLAGLDVLRILNEPTAAALAYGVGLEDKESQLIAVYDLGGGTFDITILEMTGGIFEVLSTNGDTHLGGDDIDQLIVNHWIELDGALSGKRASLRTIATKAKKTLSKEESFQTQWQGHPLKMSRELLEELLRPMIQKTIDSCIQALKDANLGVQEIDRVLLVGGSTRIPLIKQVVGDFFGRVPDDSLHPDHAVALGAAVQADILAGNNTDMLLIDVTPLSLGIETMGKLMDVIIPRNTKIPCQYKREYTTSVDGQVNLRVSVYQGERDSITDNRKLGEFILSGIPPMPAGLPKIEISFLLDADGILQVSAKELRSEVEQSVKIRPSYGLTEEEMAQMLLDSLQHASADIQMRKKQEAINDCEAQIRATHKFIEQNKLLLTDEELELLEAQIETLERSKTHEADEILQTLESHNEITRPIAQRMMDRTISKALKGQNIDHTN